MTPEQLEAIEGIGPKTVEKISLAVNNYFSSLEAGEAAAVPEEASSEAQEAPAEAIAEQPAAEESESQAVEAAGEAEPVEAAAVEDIAVPAEESGEEPAPSEEKQE
jgi:N utilization substance protein A